MQALTTAIICTTVCVAACGDTLDQQTQNRHDELFPLERDPNGLFYPAVEAANPNIQLLYHVPTLQEVQQSIIANDPSAPVALPPAAPSLARTIGTGNEYRLMPNGRLAFGFRADGTALMYNVHSSDTNPNNPSTYDRGRWSQHGDQIDIAFSNCIYHGCISQGWLLGTGQSQNDPIWPFQVRIIPANKVGASG